MSSLPITAALGDLREALRQHNRCLLQAPPGAGKTTGVPPALLDAPWLDGQKILMLEPRRIAARSAARFMARQRGEQPGETVGYRLRLDSRVGPATRIEVVTEGILTRMIQDDPGLEGVGCVIFDEFHERNLQGDLGLALLLQAQTLLREELRILVMSATLESDALLRLLGPQTPVVSSQGRSFPVTTRYLGGSPLPFDRERMADAIVRALAETDGDLLCFLPGTGEIRRTLETLKGRTLPGDAMVIPLYGALSPEQQDRAIRPSPEGERKVVLATAIAETSLTIEGVTGVIDAGLMRLPRFDPRSGMTRLETQVVSTASAEQRRGRAGRLGPGVCYRLWSEERQLAAHTAAEILNADLAPLALELAQWGCEAGELEWIDPPPAPHLEQGKALLNQLEAVRDGRITDAGRSMLRLGTHPRLAHLMLQARRLGHGGLGCELAALLSERDILAAGADSCDVGQRLGPLRRSHDFQRIRETARRWQRQLDCTGQSGGDDQTGLLLAFAFPDRIARRRRDGSWQYRLRNGRGAEFSRYDRLCESEFIVAADLDGQARNARIYLAAPLSREALEQHFGNQIETSEQVGWDEPSQAVRGRRIRRLGELVIDETPLTALSADQIGAGLLDGIRRTGLGCLPWNPESRTLQARVRLLRQQPSEADGWPDLDDEALLQTLEAWLLPYLDGCRRLADLKRLDLYSLLRHQLDWDSQQRLDRLAPTTVEVPSGSRLAIDYLDHPEPHLAARIQELFGWTRSPCILDGRLPLTLELLSPARRPIQVTRDLASFWAHTYFEVCKDLKGRYPKHYWPDNPLEATATRGTKKQMRSP